MLPIANYLLEEIIDEVMKVIDKDKEKK